MRPPLFLADLGARVIGRLDPEEAHALTVKLMARGFGPRPHIALDPRHATRLAGIDFPNPLGLAAGFDKNAVCPDAMLDLGFGFVEIGAATPLPQSGNERPRVFRLVEDLAVINRYGFNNDGLEKIAARLEARRKRGVVGANLGVNKETAEPAADYAAGIRRLEGLVQFYTINVSSPNTPGLRALQSKAALEAVLKAALSARDALREKAPLFLKIAPDLTDEDKADIADVARAMKIDALIISNTTITRPPALKSKYAGEKGGLSGAPLFAPSTALLGEFYKTLKGEIPLIGVGGVSSARDAYKKILAGASLVQLYTALVYQGPSLAARIVKELPAFLDAEGFSSLSEAVGAGA
ncbi:MAG TPA: quinone-dependent dihydroorotate dehydrogenase [Parvularculaceae bacterium]|nr:quinone-dependent dihydroorotate dehydrogenase [Parvularculaceae bacterium]